MTICEHLPRIAKITDKHAVIRSMTSPFVEHRDAIALAHDGLPSAALARVSVRGRGVSKELGPRAGMPPYVAIPQMYTSQGGGFLGGEYGPFISGDPNATGYKVRDLNLPDRHRLEPRQPSPVPAQAARLAVPRHGRRGRVPDARQVLRKAYTLMRAPKVEKAFAIHEESEQTRNQYGRTPFGQGCLLARRLVEAGTRFITVSKGWLTWDTHFENFSRMETLLLPEFDMAYSALLTDLDQRGLIKNTLVIAMGEFGRTPKVNAVGRPRPLGPAYSILVSGAGVVGGQNIGATDETAGQVKDYPCTIEDLMTTIYDRLGSIRTRNIRVRSAVPCAWRIPGR